MLTLATRAKYRVTADQQQQWCLLQQLVMYFNYWHSRQWAGDQGRCGLNSVPQPTVPLPTFPGQSCFAGPAKELRDADKGCC